MRKYFFITLFLLFFPLLVAGCSNKENVETAVIKIGEVEYNSLAEAIASAEENDTILIFNNVKENLDNKYLDVLEVASINNNSYVAYEIDKPLTIKGVSQFGKKPKIYGSFLINVAKPDKVEVPVTIDNLDITHDYISTIDDTLNEKFTCGVRVIDGAANIVNNDIKMGKQIENSVIEKNDLSLYYGVMLSRPKDSENSTKALNYEINNNNFGVYNSSKNDITNSAFLIVQNYQDIGPFSPSRINGASNDYSLAVYIKNKFDMDSLCYTCDYDNLEINYNGLVTQSQSVFNPEKMKSQNSKSIFIGDYIVEDKKIVEVYGTMIFNADVDNVDFHLMNKDSKVIVEGDLINSEVINKYE